MVDRLVDADRAALRRAVFALRQRERRRVFPARLHVGVLEGEQAVHALDSAPGDHGLRTDVVAALLRQRPEGVPNAAWLTRAGAPEPHDLDLLWLPAVEGAFAESGAPPRWFVVVTRYGWWHPHTGERVTWQRLRIRR